MAISNTSGKVCQGLLGAFLGLTGSGLFVICLGGMLTLGALSLFQLGALLSLGGMGLCLALAGAYWLCGALSGDTAKKSPSPALEDEGSRGSLQENDVFLKKPHTPLVKQPFNRQRNPVKTEEPEPRLRKSASYSLN
jgi:hypothetical protein